MEGKSRYSTVAWVILGGSNIFASAPSLSSGTLVTPTRASNIPIRAASCTPVKIVNRDVLPTMGKPIIAVFIKSLTEEPKNRGTEEPYKGTSTSVQVC